MCEGIFFRIKLNRIAMSQSTFCIIEIKPASQPTSPISLQIL
jgi:hypothetical protein